MRRLAILLLSFSALSASPPHYSASLNLETNLIGVPDTRLETWGTQGSLVWPIHFDAPSGLRVRILRIYGDFIIWPRGKVPEGTYAGTLFSMHTSDPQQPTSFPLMSLMADNCFLYLQMATGGKPERAPFDVDVHDGGLLSPDNTLYVKVAVWLNDTGLAIHMEPTWVTVFQLEDGAGNVVSGRREVNVVSGTRKTPASSSQR